MKKVFQITAILLVLCFAIVCGFIGLDFGYHWDEEQTLRSVVASIETGVFLPSLYMYPGMNYIIPLWSLLPTVARAVMTKTPPPLPPNSNIVLPEYLTNDKPPTGTKLDEIQRGLKLFAWSPLYWLRVRAVYLIISLLVVLWTFISLMAWRKRFWEAFLGASFLALSWEFAYHSRWIAPDQMMTSFVALSLMFVFIARTRENVRPWFTLAAISAGVACGTKYQGAIALLPLFITVLRHAWIQSPKRIPWREWSKLGLIFFASYLVTTPGTILDPLRFSHDLLFQFKVYWNGWEDHTIPRGPEHLLKIFGYYSLSAFSHYVPIAITVFVLTIVGAIAAARDDRWDAAILIGVPLLYTLYMSTQHVMFVRNYLLVVPFMAILAARGVGGCMEWFRRKPGLRYAISGVLCLMLILNAAWLWNSAQTVSVRKYARYRYPLALADYLNDHKDNIYALSTKVQSELLGLNGTIPANAHSSLDAAHYAVFYSREVDSPARWNATHFNYTNTWFGPYEVNFNYYPSWKGDDRIIVLHARDAVPLGVF